MIDPESLPRRQMLLDSLKEFEPFYSVLDIGCGYGEDLDLIKEKYPNVEVCGIEKTANKAETKKFILNLDAIAIQDNRIWKNNSADIVISDAAIMYIDWPAGALKEMYRIAKKGIIMLEQKSYYLDQALKDYRIESIPIEFWKPTAYLYKIKK